MSNGMEQFQKAFNDVPTPPCQNCLDHDKCGKEELACVAFLQYVVSPAGRFQYAQRRNPTNKIYTKIYKEEELENA